MNKVIYKIDGVCYTWSGWFGCQLESYEWTRVPAGTKRTILGREFTVFTTERKGLKIRTTWATYLPIKGDEANKMLFKLKDDLKSL